MAAENEGQDIGAKASGAGIDPAAVALALGGASRAKADAFLANQNALLDIQKHHLTEQFKQSGLSVLRRWIKDAVAGSTGHMGNVS